MSAFYLKLRDDYAHECIECRLANANGQPTGKTTLNREQAMLELTLLNAESIEQGFDDVILEGLRGGIPPEILTRMKELWEKTKDVGGEVIEVGKIIVMKIIEFLKAHPKLASSLAIGAATYLLAHAIPIIGPMLAPLLAAIMTVYALWKQHSVDEIIKLANKFFELVISVFNAVADRWAAA